MALILKGDMVVAIKPASAKSSQQAWKLSRPLGIGFPGLARCRWIDQEDSRSNSALPGLDYEKEDLNHATGIDDEDDWCPDQNLSGIKLSRHIRLCDDDDGEDGEDDRPRLNDFPFDHSNDDDGNVNQDDDNSVYPRQEGSAGVWS